MVGDQEAVAEVRDIEERLAHEPILVPNERDADDLHCTHRSPIAKSSSDGKLCRRRLEGIQAEPITEVMGWKVQRGLHRILGRTRGGRGVVRLTLLGRPLE
jgi:hypothetical protein